MKANPWRRPSGTERNLPRRKRDEVMATLTGLFDIEREGDTLIVIPVTNLNELRYEQIQEEMKDIFDLIDQDTIKNVVLDLGKMDYCGSTALGYFIKLWKKFKASDGEMAFCNVSAHEKDIMRITRLGELWPICSSREEALETVEREDLASGSGEEIKL
jgi:anti-anti-sigma factor